MTSFIIVSILIVLFIVGLQLLLRKKSRKSVGTDIPADKFNDPFFAGEGKKMLYFYSPSCAVCRQMMPAVDDLRERYPDKVMKVNVGQSLDLSRSLNIMATPSTVILDGRTVTDVFMGLQKKQKLLGFLQLAE